MKQKNTNTQTQINRGRNGGKCEESGRPGMGQIRNREGCGKRKNRERKGWK